MSANRPRQAPTWKISGTGMKPACPFSTVGIPKLRMSAEPMPGPINMGNRTKKIMRIPRNLPRLFSGNKSFNHDIAAIEADILNICHANPARASSRMLRTNEKAKQPRQVSTTESAIIKRLLILSALKVQ